MARAYFVKSEKLSGTSYGDVYKKAFAIYKRIKARTKRRPYIRSAYFNKDKIFLGLFWSHLKDKHHRERTRRLKYFPCAIELIKNSRLDPTSKENLEKTSEILHRFRGITPEKEIFLVQIKENKRNNQKYLISVFPL